ncbi:fatty-acyl-CoA synthase [Pseudonocardia thermophila]|uniref:Fatty-acyl-CoA synthase n=1 Tax=Pseudonocardia thermophila TaxID=1848 RepID=A0A1M6XP25_PSETH|nr:AMP-binding protein [Pseudonocardia thermophila]SHL07638.1 fatty-acyl-CoA synthase [Pseudonocardia thermophila]
MTSTDPIVGSPNGAGPANALPAPAEPTIADALAAIARRSPASPAVGRRGERLRTYAELHERTDRLANAFTAAGLRPGAPVGAWMEDCPEYLEVYLAAAKAGLVVVPVNARFTAEEARYALDRGDVQALVFTDGTAPKVEEAAADRPLRLTLTPGTERVAGAAAYQDVLAAAAATRAAAAVPGDAPYIMAFTSGTTGFPKAAVLTHRSVMTVCRSQVAATRLPAYGVRAHTNSMSFTSSVSAHLLPTLFTGGASVLMGTGWHVDDLLDVVERYRATHTTIPSPFVRDLVEHLGGAPDRLGSLQSILHAGSKVDGSLLQQLGELAGARFVEGWGMTENSGGLVCSTSALDVLGASPIGSAVFDTVGRPVPGVEVEVVGADGAPLPHDGESVGELLVRSPSLVAGYWRDEAATAKAFRDGWYHSGDLGSIDAHGYVRVVDRRADLIVSGGMNIYPAEVERVLRTHPAVAECAVVAGPHERWGQTPVAVVVVRPGVSLTQDEVIAHCRAHLAGYKKPTSVLFVEQLPRNSSDKIARERLRQIVAAAAG